MRRVLCCVMWLALAAPAWALTADEQLRFADGIYLRGLHESAVGEYLLFLRDYPESEHVPAVLYRTGECYRQMGNQSGAERFYKRVADEFGASPQAQRALLRRAEFALHEGRASDALGWLEQLLAGDAPGETAAAALYYQGQAQRQLKKKDAATAAFEAVLAQHGGSPHAALAALELTELHGGARQKEADVARWFEGAVESAATPSAKAEALFRWGGWAYRQGKYQLAHDVLQSLVVELPEERRAGDALLATGWSLYYLDKVPEALETADRLLGKGGDAESSASALYLRANCLRKMNRDMEALRDYESIVKKYPGTRFSNRAAYDIMATHFKRGDSAKTLASAPVQPEAQHEADVLWMTAESERLLDREDAARGSYGRLLARFPKSSQAASALMRLGGLERDRGRLAEAAGYFRRVADEFAASEYAADALQASALAALRMGDAEGALADWDRVLKLQLDAEELAEARLHQATALIELGRDEEAMESLNAVLQMKAAADQLASAHYWMGRLWINREKWSDAEGELRRALGSSLDARTETLARLYLVAVLQRQERMDEAVDQMEPLLEDASWVADNASLMDWAISRWFEQDKNELSLRAARQLAEFAREANWRQIAWYWVGANEIQRGDETAAIRAYESAVAQNARTRQGAESQLLLAKLELAGGRYERAAEGYRAAAESARGEDSLDLLVRAYFGLGETAEAQEDWAAAARHYMSVAVLFDDPEWTPHALYRAGRLFGLTDQAAAQQQAWDELAARYPQSSFAMQVREGGR